MSNLKHYIKGISSGNTYFSLSRKFRFLAYSLGFYELLVAIAYYMAKIYPMMVYSVFVGLFFFVIINNLIKQERYTTSMLMSLSIIIITAFLSTLYVGFECGFAQYCYACIAGMFYMSFVIDKLKNKTGVPFLCSLVFLICYLSIYVMMIFLPAVQPLSSAWTRAFHIGNSLISFFTVIIFNILFIWEINVRNNMLSTQNEQLDELAHKDPLTHLLNRRSMNTFLTRSMDVLRSTGKRFSLILCDIDDFKHVNDTYGHDAGDLVLVTIANIITESLRDGDVVCRWGGEEILILINDPIETASMAAERIRKKIEEATTTFEGKPINITMTFGIAESIPGYRIEQLIQQADDKLYIGKKNGKNQVVI